MICLTNLLRGIMIVPTVYPVDIYVRLCLVDALQRFGVERYHMSEVENVLNYTYR